MRENSMYVHLFLVLQKMYWNEYVFKRYLTRFKQIFFATFTVYNNHVFINLFKIVTVFLGNGEIFALVFNIH
jgi:hypothetical protein